MGESGNAGSAPQKHGDDEEDEQELGKKGSGEDENAVSSGNSESSGKLKPEPNTTGPPQTLPCRMRVRYGVRIKLASLQVPK